VESGPRRKAPLAWLLGVGIVSVDAEGHLAGDGIARHVMRAGQRFDLEARRPVP